MLLTRVEPEAPVLFEGPAFRPWVRDGDSCRHCDLPIRNVEEDTYRKNRGAHKLCLSAHIEMLRHARVSLAWWPRAVTLAKYRSKKKGYDDFQLNTYHPLDLPVYCPVLGMKLRYTRNGKVSDNSASLDQIVAGGGYNYKNAIVVSWRANYLKGDAHSSELWEVVRWMIKEGA